MSFTNLVNRADYPGANTTATFNYSFKVFDEDELRVTVVDSAGEETLLVIDTDYTVTGAGESAGGTVVLVDNNQAWLDTTSGYLKTTYDITIRRVLPLTQETDIRNQGEFFASSHEDQFDRLVMIAQQQQDEIDRCIKVPETEDGSGLEIPSVDTRASKLFGFDADGDPIATSAGVNTAIVSAFGETLIDDADAGTARTTLGAQQETSALTALTAPVLADVLPIYDDSASANRKITPDNLFKVVDLFTKTTAPVPADILPVYDSVNSAIKGIYLADVFAGARRAGSFANIGFTASTNVLTIGGATASLGAANPAFVCLPDTSSFGRVTVLRATADLTLTLGAAHWDYDTRGDLTNAELWIYAINDGSGTLKVAASVLGGLTSIASADTETTAANVTTAAKILVNAALSSGTWPCISLGYILANRNDTTNAWTIVTTVGGLNVGQKLRDYIPMTSYTSTTSGFNSLASQSMWYSRDKDHVLIFGRVTASGGVASSETQIGLPSGCVIAPPTSTPNNPMLVQGRWWQNGASATSIKGGPITATSGNTYVGMGYDDYTGAFSPYAARTTSIFSSGVMFGLNARVRVLGWSHN